MSTTTLADVLYPGAHAPGGPEPQSPPSDLTPNSPNGGGSSPGSDDDGASRKRSASGSLKEGKERTANKICRVCGDKAYSYNFNVITCESCKAFFRRNANKEKEIRCPFNESCEINVVSRRFCQRCRLFKCFQVGMKKEWIMTDEARLEKKARVEENRERRREEAKRKDDGSGGHYRTTSVSSSNGGCSAPGSAKSSSSCSATAAAAAAAASVAADTAIIMQHHHQQQQQQQQLQHAQHVQQQVQQAQAAMFQPELPTLATSTATSNMLDALVQQAAAAAAPAALQAPFAAAAMPTAAALVAAVAAPPPQQPTTNELMAHAIALEQLQQQTSSFGVIQPPPVSVQQQPTAAATAVAAYQAAAVAAHHQQQQMAAQTAAIAQQIVSAQQQIDANAAIAAALALPQPTPVSQASAVAILNAAAAASGASPLGPLSSTALIMDATSAAATQQLLAAAAAPPSALAAVASTMLLAPSQQQSLLQPTLPADRCSCTCSCGKYHGPRAIVDQAQEEWEADRIGQRSHSSDEHGLAELLPSGDSGVAWLNPSLNQNPLTEGALMPTMAVEEAYRDMAVAKDQFVNNPLLAPNGPRGCVDPEFGAMEADDDARLAFIHEANKVWTKELEGAEQKLHSESLPSKEGMLQMMVGAVQRMIKMAKKFPALKQLHETDQLKLIKSCYLDVMIIRGAMAYDPAENAWKGPTNKHNYKIKMDAMNDGSQDNMFNQSVRLYAMFKEEYRQEESVMLLLNMIVLFDPKAEGLTDVASVTAENNAYKRCLKRYMYTKMNKNVNRVQLEFKSLLDRLATVRKMNSGARGIMVEHADNMDPLLKELLAADDKDKDTNTNPPSTKRHSPRSVSSMGSVASIDEQPTTSAMA